MPVYDWTRSCKFERRRCILREDLVPPKARFLGNLFAVTELPARPPFGTSDAPVSRSPLIRQPNRNLTAMNAQLLKEKWSLIRDKLREKYPNLTDNDLAYIRDREEEVFERVERRTGLKRAEVEQTLLSEISFAWGRELRGVP